MARRGRPQIQVREDPAQIEAYRAWAAANGQELAPFVRYLLTVLRERWPTIAAAVPELRPPPG